jgi:uncharacterized protein YdaU (DUF1376 family)
MTRIDTWMPLYVADYLADTGRLTTEQHGAYLMLIFDYWRNGPLPDDEIALSAITRLHGEAWQRNRAAVLRFFTLQDGSWYHARIDAELLRALACAEQRSLAGKASAEARQRKRKGERIGNETATVVATDVGTPVATALQRECEIASTDMQNRPKAADFVSNRESSQSAGSEATAQRPFNELDDDAKPALAAVQASIGRVESDPVYTVDRERGGNEMATTVATDVGTEPPTNVQQKGRPSQSPIHVFTDVNTSVLTHDARAAKRPKTRKIRAGEMCRLPDDFAVSDRVSTWAASQGYQRLADHLQSFKLKAAAKGYRYADWDAALMNAIRDNWAGLPVAPITTAHATGGAHARPYEQAI